MRLMVCFCNTNLVQGTGFAASRPFLFHRGSPGSRPVLPSSDRLPPCGGSCWCRSRPLPFSTDRWPNAVCLAPRPPWWPRLRRERCQCLICCPRTDHGLDALLLPSAVDLFLRYLKVVARYLKVVAILRIASYKMRIIWMSCRKIKKLELNSLQVHS